MKKLIAVLIAMLVVFGCLSIFICAEEPDAETEVETEVETETEPAEAEEPEGSTIPKLSEVDYEKIARDIIEIMTTKQADEDENATVFTRLWNYVVENKVAFYCIIGNIILVIIFYFVHRIQKRTNVNIIETTGAILEKVKGTSGSNAKMVDAMNGMIEGYNKMEALFESNATNEEDREKLVSAVLIQNTAILEMIREAYSQNKNLPQGVKDLISLSYATAKKTIGDDERLSEVAKMAKDILDEKVEEKV